MSAMRCATPTSPLPAASDSTSGASGHAHSLMEEGSTMGWKAGDIDDVVFLANALLLALAGAAHAQSTYTGHDRYRVGAGNSGYVRGDYGGGRSIKKTKTT